MSDFFIALKTDLTDRRLVPFVALAVVALLGALGYAALGGGSSSSSPTVAVTHIATPGVLPGLPISQSTPESAVAETTDGATTQRKGAARDPFAALPAVEKAAKAAAAAAAAAAKSSAAGSTSSKSASGGATSSKSSGSSTTTPSQPAAPSKPAKPQTVYDVSVLFGVTPATATPAGTPLTAYKNLKLQTPLPSAKQPLVVFRGVTAGAKSAIFTLVGEAILHGTAGCLPSPSQCQAIDIQPGKVEQLEFLVGLTTVTYELEVTAIKAVTASSGTVKSLLLHGQSQAGREVLRRAGLIAIPYLSYSSHLGVLVFANRRASVARAHVALAHRRGR